MDISKDIFRQIPSPALSLNDLLVTVNTGETDRRQKKGSKEGREGERKKERKEERETKGERKGKTYLTHKTFKDISLLPTF